MYSVVTDKGGRPKRIGRKAKLKKKNKKKKNCEFKILDIKKILLDYILISNQFKQLTKHSNIPISYLLNIMFKT